jgi:hypothetical protein
MKPFRMIRKADAVIVLQILTGMEPDGLRQCVDVNDDGKIGSKELIYVLRKVAGLIMQKTASLNFCTPEGVFDKMIRRT